MIQKFELGSGTGAGDDASVKAGAETATTVEGGSRPTPPTPSMFSAFSILTTSTTGSGSSLHSHSCAASLTAFGHGSPRSPRSHWPLPLPSPLSLTDWGTTTSSRASTSPGVTSRTVQTVRSRCLSASRLIPIRSATSGNINYEQMDEHGHGPSSGVRRERQFDLQWTTRGQGSEVLLRYLNKPSLAQYMIDIIMLVVSPFPRLIDRQVRAIVSGTAFRTTVTSILVNLSPCLIFLISEIHCHWQPAFNSCFHREKKVVLSMNILFVSHQLRKACYSVAEQTLQAYKKCTSELYRS